jgi:preprotein translocase SecE subunit
MAVAVKHNQDTSSTGLLDRLPVALFMGVLYVFGSLGIIFPLLESVWWQYVFPDGRANPVAWVVRVVVTALLGFGLLRLGLVLLGPKPAHGLKAGITLTSAALGLLALLGLYLGRAIEDLVYTSRWFGASDHTGGLILAGGIVGALVLGLIYLVVHPRAEKFFATVEDQGWFSLSSYKRNQGQRVRRGTIIGIVLVLGFGLRSLNSTLERDPGNWTVPVPFTGKARVTAYTAGDSPEFKDLRQEEWAALNAEAERLNGVVTATPKLSSLKDQASRVVAAAQAQKNLDAARRQLTELRQTVVDQGGDPGEAGTPAPGGVDLAQDVERFALRDANERFVKGSVKITAPGFPGTEDRPKREFTEGDIVPESEVEAESKSRDAFRKKLEEAGQADEAELIRNPTTTKVQGATGEPHYYSLVLLPAVQYTLPALLGLLAVWFAWRIVNLPAFADFLIATEAELNKVSWVTRRQLAQDTVVVLVTVLLMTIFLLFADIGWSQFLKGIGVLHPGQTRQQQADQELKW